MDLYAKVFVAFSLAGVQSVSAQRFATVQLPTIRTFSLSTTVTVPDRGSAYAGGVRHGFRQSSRRSHPLLPTPNRSFVGGAAANNVSVSAHMHDLREIDHAVLREWERLKTTRPAPARFHSDLPERATLPRDDEDPQASVSNVRRALQRERSADQKRAEHDYQLGRRLEAKGELTAAGVVYRNALKRADEQLTSQLISRLTAIESAQMARQTPAAKAR